MNAQRHTELTMLRAVHTGPWLVGRGVLTPPPAARTPSSFGGAVRTPRPTSAGVASAINRSESSCPLCRGHWFPAKQRRCARGRWSRGLISPRLAFPGRTPAGFPLNSRGWREERATPPEPRRTAPEPRRGSPGSTPSTARGMGPPRRGGGHCGRQFRGCARASRTPGYSGTTPPGLSGRIPATTFATTFATTAPVIPP